MKEGRATILILTGCPPAFEVQPSLRFSGKLNASQSRAVKQILSQQPNRRVTVCHGPPGTGKTTVIAAAVSSIMSASKDHSIWLVAHSNVAVKNVAEKLVADGFVDFKILISKEFHFDWFVFRTPPELPFSHQLIGMSICIKT